MKNTKKVMVGTLHRNIREELFKLHVLEFPRATEVSFYKKFVSVVRIDVAKLREKSLLVGMSADEETRYLEVLGVRATRYPAVSRGMLVDGLHRLTVAKRNGLLELDALDFSRFIDPRKSRYRIKLRLN
ncbi:hypothetical protein AWB71_05310 [Caballeronia peredens]|nr:hypothetical protein AWB71_05310 [Caballeronia peredens]